MKYSEGQPLFPSPQISCTGLAPPLNTLAASPAHACACAAPSSAALARLAAGSGAASPAFAGAAAAAAAGCLFSLAPKPTVVTPPDGAPKPTCARGAMGRAAG